MHLRCHQRTIEIDDDDDDDEKILRCGSCVFCYLSARGSRGRLLSAL